MPPPKPAFIGARAFDNYRRRRSSSPTSTGRRSFRPGNSRGAIRRSSMTRNTARRRAACSKTRQAMLKRIVDEQLVHAEGRHRLLAGERAMATTSRSTTTRARTQIATLHTLAPADRAPRRHGQRGARGFRRAEGGGAGRLCRRLRVTAGAGRKRSPTRFKPAPMTTIGRSWSRRWPTVWRKLSPSACMSACGKEFWGYARGRELSRPTRTDRGKLSRHPAGAGLSGAARSHRKGDDVRTARRSKAHRGEADRKLRDVAGRVGQRALFRASGERIISASPRSSAIRSRITPAARAWSIARSNAGSRRSSTTIRRQKPRRKPRSRVRTAQALVSLAAKKRHRSGSPAPVSYELWPPKLHEAAILGLITSLLELRTPQAEPRRQTQTRREQRGH